MSSLEFGVGALLALGATGAPAPSPDSFTLPRSGQLARESASLGLAYGGGVAAEARAFEWLGLSVGALYRRDSATSDVSRDGTQAELTLSQPALHVPITLKGYYPLAPLSPFALLGVELVLPGLSRAQVEPAAARSAVASAEPHTFLLVGAGAELELESLATFRPAASVSFGFRPGKSESLADRLTVLPSDAAVYDSAFSWQLTLQAGASYFW